MTPSPDSAARPGPAALPDNDSEATLTPADPQALGVSAAPTEAKTLPPGPDSWATLPPPDAPAATAASPAGVLGRLLTEEPTRARPVGAVKRGWRWCRRNLEVAGLLALLMLTLLGVTVVSVYFAWRAGRTLDAKEDQLTRVEWLLYASQINSAQREWETGNAVAAWRLLGSCQGNLRGWEHRYLSALSARNQRTLQGHTNDVTSVAFSPDGKRLVSGSFDKTLKVWDADKGTQLLTLRGHTEGVHSVAFSPDSKRIASASFDRRVKIWDADKGTELLTLTGHTWFVRRVAFSPDGKRLASAGGDNTVKVWNAAKGTELLSLTGHTDIISSVAFSPDGKRIASASMDQTVKLWEADKGTELLTLQGHGDSVLSVTFSPDGKRLACALEDKTVKVWDADEDAIRAAEE